MEPRGAVQSRTQELYKSINRSALDLTQSLGVNESAKCFMCPKVVGRPPGDIEPTVYPWKIMNPSGGEPGAVNALAWAVARWWISRLGAVYESSRLIPPTPPLPLPPRHAQSRLRVPPARRWRGSPLKLSSALSRAYDQSCTLPVGA